MLILSLLVLILALLSLSLAILFQLWKTHETTTIAILSIQRVLNAFDRPQTLAQNAVEVGQSWIATDQEMSSVEEKLRSESRQRAGSVRSRRSSTPVTG